MGHPVRVNSHYTYLPMSQKNLATSAKFRYEKIHAWSKINTIAPYLELLVWMAEKTVVIDSESCGPTPHPQGTKCADKTEPSKVDCSQMHLQTLQTNDGLLAYRTHQKPNMEVLIVSRFLQLSLI